MELLIPPEYFFYDPLEKKIVANGEEYIVTTLLTKLRGSVLLVLKFNLFMYLYLTGINLQEETNWLQLVILLPSLSELYLEYCGLRNIYPPLQYANFTALDVLDLFNNDFVPAMLPNWIFNFSSGILAIFLSKNSLQGQLLQTFPHFQSLDSLFLDDNDLNGSTPNWGQFQVVVKSVYSLLEMWSELNISSLFELQFLSFLEFATMTSALSIIMYQDLTGINLQEETNWLQLVTLLASLSELYLEYYGLRDIYPSLQYANFTAFDTLNLSNNDFVPAKLPTWIFNFSSGELNISSLFELQFLSFLEFATMTSASSIIMYQDLTGINLQEETNWLQLVTLLASLSELYLEYYGLRDIYPSLQYANFIAFDALNLSNNDFVPAKLPTWIFNFSSGELNISSLFELQFLSFLEFATMTSASSIIMYQDLTGINLQEETNWLQLVTLLASLSELYLEYYGLRDIYPSLQYANFIAFDALNLSNNDFVPAKLPTWIFNFSSGELNISSLFELQFLSFLEFATMTSASSIIMYQDLTGINLQEETNWLQLVTLLASLSELYLEYYGLRDIYPSLQYANFTAFDAFNLSNNDFVPAKLPTWIFIFSSGELNISSLFELQFLSFLEFATMTSGSSIIMYQDLTGINLQEETNWLQLVTLLPSLSELYLEYCGLRDIYPSLQYANFTAFDALNLSNNDFVPAKLPTWIFNFSSGISTIFLSKTSLQCQLPQTFLQFQPDSLFLDDNDLNGSIPNWVG
ncbi:hypothetical protein HN51_054060 [Arachis hypogaea]